MNRAEAIVLKPYPQNIMSYSNLGFGDSFGHNLQVRTEKYGPDL
jgi:hypothetical protein